MYQYICTGHPSHSVRLGTNRYVTVANPAFGQLNTDTLLNFLRRQEFSLARRFGRPGPRQEFTGVYHKYIIRYIRYRVYDIYDIYDIYGIL